MLQDNDLKRFQEHFRRATAEDTPPVDPATVLTAAAGLHFDEVQRLASSLQIAAVLGDATMAEATAAGAIARQVRTVQSLGLEHAMAWQTAISWANSQQVLDPPPPAFAGLAYRSIEVGQACLRLRQRGYALTVRAHGVDVPDATSEAVIRRIDEQVEKLGGVDTALQVCRTFVDRELIHDGMWMMGNRVPDAAAPRFPDLPAGWIFSLALRHLTKMSRPSDPAAVWKGLCELATDYAAAMNCQRYSQFEELDVGPASTWYVLRDSLLWREIFALPQVPRQVVPSLQEAFRLVLTNDDRGALDWDLDAACDEIGRLAARGSDRNLTRHPRKRMSKEFPHLWKIGVGEAGTVNPDYLHPTQGGKRNQSDFIFFAYTNDEVLTLPTPLLREAFCQAVFRRVWTKLPKARAPDVVGQVFEKALERACAGKASTVLAGATYAIGKQKFELDVATREDDKVVFFETKSKSLTAVARSGDLLAFYQDYADSFLLMAHQLVRHDEFLRQGLTPLTTIGGNCASFWSLKVAVSPLSYGPASDKFLGNGLLRSFYGVKLQPVSQDPAQKKATDKINKAVPQIFSVVDRLARTTKDGTPNRFAYILDLFWLDLGQVLYALNRGKTVFDAFMALRSFTFSSRDFWTEVGFAEKQDLTKDRWNPLPGRNASS